MTFDAEKSVADFEQRTLKPMEGRTIRKVWTELSPDKSCYRIVMSFKGGSHVAGDFHLYVPLTVERFNEFMSSKEESAKEAAINKAWKPGREFI
jgi:hypothetical protein